MVDYSLYRDQIAYQKNMQHIIQCLFALKKQSNRSPNIYDLSFMTGLTEETILESMEFSS